MSTDPLDSGYRRPAQKRPRSTWFIALCILAAALLIALGGYLLAHRTPAQGTAGGRFGGRGGFGGAGAPMPVGAAEVGTGDIDITLNALGTVTPLRNVTVSAQIPGQLQRVNFTEGQMVNQGDLLAEIDPRPYEAALTQAEGALARDQALLANAKIDLDRYATLFKEDSIAKQQLDSQASLVRQYEGTVKSDEGQIGTAKVNLAYTKVLAPVSGRVGLRQVDPGNNVQNGSGIVVITQLMPIDVLFTMPEDNLPAVLKKMHGGGSLKVDVYDRAGQNKLGSGTLASLDNQIDTSTGTVKAKAEFANSDQALFPNQFVNARVLLDVLHGATVIPTSALQQGANGLFVYVVKPDHTVTVRTIKTGPTQGERVAVESGLTVGETIVTEGGDRLREGSKVQLPGEAPPSGGDRAQQERGQERKTDGEAQPDQQGQHRRRGGSDQNDAGKGASPAPGPGSTSPAPAGGKSGGASDGSGG